MGQAKYQVDGDPRTSGPGFGVSLHPDVLQVPLRRKVPTMFFVNSMSDLFHDDVGSAFIASVFDTMRQCPQHTFQILTKRAKRMAVLMRSGVPGDSSPLPNVWLGTSIENDRYTFRADLLRATPAAVRFLSCEPLLGPLPSLDLAGIDWCIIGGESGPGARPMELAWAADIVRRCRDAGVPVFVKQLGSVWAKTYGRRGDRKGHDIDLWPDDLRVREWPNNRR